MRNDFIKKSSPHIIAFLVFLFLSLVYLSPLLEGKKLRQDDVTRHKGMSKEIVDHREKTGEEPLWTNSMFSGMPAYNISVLYKGNLVKHISKMFHLGLPRPAGHVFFYMIGFYILLLVLGVNPWLCIAGAIAYGFSTYFFIILEAGHNTKAIAIGYMAPVIAGIILTYRGKYILGGIITMLFLALEISANHPQISYYLILIILILGISELVNVIKTKDYKPFIKATIVVFIAGVIAVLTSVSSLWATYEYGKYTIRGKTELTSKKENRTSGLDKDYATQWSYGKGETFSLMIPNIKGGATSAIGDNDYALKNVNDQYKQHVAGSNQYWGDQPFTSGPVYVGAFIVFLFIYSLFIVKGRVKWWLLIATILSITLAWGKNFMPLTDFFLDYIPGYNKFRAVSMTLVIAELTIPLLAFLALNKLINEPENLKKKIDIFNFKINPLYISFALTAGISLLFALMPNTFFTFLSDQEVQSIAQQKSTNPEYASQISDYYFNIELARAAILKADAFRSFIFILFGTIVLWVYSIGKIKKNIIFLILIGLILIDLWSVDKRYLNNDNFVSKSKTERPYLKTKADEIILKDKDPNFRVLNLSVDPFADASTSYFHKSIGGYHGAKLRRYQELYDHHIKSKFNMEVINMLNTRYIIQPDENKNLTVVPNTQALGNAWFVEDIKFVKNADEELSALNNFNPEKTAFIDEQFSNEIGNFSPELDSAALIQLIEYAPNDLKYQVNTKKDQLTVFSEIYYPKGWNAYVDGKLTPHFRANYVLRAMIIPAGRHLVEFKFEPTVYKVGEKISLASSLLLILSIIGYGIFEIKKYFIKKED